MVKNTRAHIQNDLLGKSNHFRYKGIIIISTEITTKVQLNSARVRTRNSEKRLVFELLADFSSRSAVANATEMAPAVAVMNPSSKNVPRARGVKASAEAGASKRKTDFLDVCGSTTSHTAANAYPRTDINHAQVNAWLVQSDSSLGVESSPIPIGVPEFNSAAIVCGNNGEPISIRSRWPLFAMML